MNDRLQNAMLESLEPCTPQENPELFDSAQADAGEPALEASSAARRLARNIPASEQRPLCGDAAIGDSLDHGLRQSKIPQIASGR